MGEWRRAIVEAIYRQIDATQSETFTRQALINDQLTRIVEEVGSVGVTPEQTLSRELQELAQEGLIQFLDHKGTYRLTPPIEPGHSEILAKYFIDGYRSLRAFHIELNLGLNALVGPNGAGKTNFIEFLDFLSTLVARDASSAVSVSGGVSRVFSQENNKKSSPKISATICSTASMSRLFDEVEGRTRFRFEYSVDVRFSKAHSAIYISDEKIKFYALHHKGEPFMHGRYIGAIHIRRRSPSMEVEPIITISPKLLTNGVRNPLRYLRRPVGRGVPPRLQRADTDFIFSVPPGPDESVLTIRPGRPALEAIRESVSRGRAFNLNPSAARDPDELSKPPMIAANGAGLSATLYHMQQLKRGLPSQWNYLFRRYGKETLDTVVEWTRLVLPELRDVSVSADPHTGKYLAYLIVDDGEKGLRIPLQAASDGTIKWLALISMIFVRSSSYSIEEPENFLHPRMQQYLISAIRDSIYEGNLLDYFLISTHSESIINQLKPEELVIFDFHRGRTFCRRLQSPESVSNEIDSTGRGLGYFYASNAIS